ncbi:hypothetical protein [Streptomyces scabiei]|uniref:hypothetical protein n=1 Tax=Streptomyces scabiei TaxID=1930 RepID=UPI000B1ECF3A|nr:hypothetical protein [Streptomyces scabiei]
MKSQPSEHIVNFSRTYGRHHRWVTISGAIAFLITLSGCAGNQEKREYSAPKSACDTPINAKALSPFLPAGKKINTKITTDSRRILKCAISVDGQLIVQTSQEWWNDMSVFEFARGMTLDDPDQQTDNDRYVYSGYQAFGKVAGCQSSKHKDQVLYAAVQAVGSKHRDAAAMKQLITDYIDAIEESDQCD